MNLKLSPFIIALCFFLPETSQGRGVSLEVPMLALKSLGESRVESCGYCVENLEKSAYKRLNRYFSPGRVFLFAGETSGGLLVSENFLKKGELLFSEYLKRAKEKNGEGKEYEFPLVTFYFHTSRHHHAGINKAIYSSESIDEVYLDENFPPRALFKGRIRIAAYPYGNGDSFIYYRNRNVLQVHCIVEELKRN